MLSDDRLKMVEFIRRQIIGPVAGLNESLRGSDRPTARYLMGTLYPQQFDSSIALEEEEECTLGNGDSGGVGDSPVSMAYQYMPSSIGISFFVTSNQVVCHVSGAQYAHLKDVASGKKRWVRSSLFESNSPYEVIISPPNSTGGVGKCKVLDDQAILHHFWRRRKNGYLLTVTLINIKKSDQQILDEDCLFQVGLVCSASVGSICEYPASDYMQWDAEEEELGLMYRHKRTFAVGHGCSADWEGSGEYADKVWAEFLPAEEVPDLTAEMDCLDGLSRKALTLQFLSDPDVSASELKKVLESFAGGYASWIEKLPSYHEDISAEQVVTKNRILDRLAVAKNRIFKGIETLVEDSDGIIRQSFCLANLAMLMQMVHSGAGYSAKPKQRNGEIFLRPDYMSQKYANLSWRPFQLAFFLLSLESLVNEESPDRDTVDLIWFPTGGGKTEAYLALAAFELFHRRFKNPEMGMGTAIIKRYTLRLLTSQQFQRVATLICACQMILNERNITQFSAGLKAFPGSFSLGLWVGGGVTPNRYSTANADGAKELYENLLSQDRPENPFQLTKCPWCGTRIVPEKISSDESDYGIEATATSFKFYCPTDSCPFHQLLPVTVVDEDIFDNPPSFIIGTIDKFARIAWDDRVAALFGKANHVLPPSLIIQDELHLISGPLGTIAGIYEAAIDTIMDANGGRPKIIAATATIRRAADQCRKLYGKKVSVFPPQGLSADDSYFSRTDNDRLGRLYLGVMAPSHRPVTSLVHVSAALAQAPIEAVVSDRAAGGYWSQVIFHNSRRELGKTMSLARDDIPARIKVITRDHSKMRSLDNIVELSANVPGKGVPEILERLESGPDMSNVIDILPCTNMFSVGVDVKRLGLMIVNGQPKTTAEYIQASSRVGRDTGVIPGLVVTLYSPTKPRDRSHYERFVSYHQCLYRAVEPTSVTPYAMPARERALHAALVAVVRLAGGLPDNDNAKHFDPTSAKISILIDRLKARIANSDLQMSDETAAHLDRIVARWTERIKQAKEEGRPLLYDKGKANSAFSSLLQYFGGSDQDAWHTLNSMRHVDQECLLHVRGS